MKLKNFASITALLLATLAAQAQTNTLVGWSFDDLMLGANSSPTAATNTGTASAVGLTNATVVAQAGSSTGSVVGTNAWKVTGGWNTNNAIGSQGAQFIANSVGYYQVQVSFDVYAATNAEALLLVQYSPDGNTWFNANITSAGSLGVLATNTITTNGIVVGTYLVLTNSGGVAAWDNGVAVNLSGVSWADNNPNFAIRIVNAAKGTNCVDTTGTKYSSNASIGDWTFDNVVIQGVPFDAAAVWTFEGLGILSINNPPPTISNTTATASCMGFNVTNTLMGSHASGKDVATNAADILANGAPYSSTGAAGQNVWRLRGQPGNGWLSVLPIGSQGAEFDVDTTGYTNMMLSFDIEFTAQSEAKMCVEYTTDGWATTNVANSLAYALNPTYIMTNTPAFTTPGLNLAGNATYSANTVNGTLLFNTFGAIFFNNVIVDLTGQPSVANNPHFAFRIVDAATGADCVNGIYGPYNNTSGNCRVDNIAVNGKYTGNIAPTVAAQTSPAATVDSPFTNTFAINPGWATNISSIIVNGLTLPPSSYVVTSSNIIYTPSLGGSALTTAGTDYITIYATNYTSAKIIQVVGPGAFAGLNFVQPVGPSASGGTLTVNPSFTCVDQFTNPTTLTFPSMQVVATVSNSPALWALGGSVTQAIFNGACTFSNLTATITNGTTAISNAAITFTVTSGPITVTNSTAFIIGKPPVPFTPGNLAVIQSDISGANSTLSIIEVQPSVAGQTTPVNIVPITATGTNALRIANAGSGGHLALSDDGTKLVFAAYTDDNSATSDETFNQNRGVGTLDYTNAYVLQAKYVSSSFGGSQARAACSPDNLHYLIDDKGGLYIAPSGTYYNLYNQNNISTKSFGGVCWVATAKTTPASPTASVFIFSDNNNANGVGLDYLSNPNDPISPNPDSVFNVGHTTPAADSFTQDFYMVSTNGNDYSILYVLDQSVTSGVGAITKYKMSGTIDTDFTWVQQGSLSLKDNGDHLFATTNGSGGVYLFFVNGNNQIIRLTDQAVGGSLTIVSSNKIYTATSGNIQGLTFVPQQTAYATELIPPPILTAQATAPVSGNITITNTPDDGNWRSNITSVTVNGVVLPRAAYNTNTAGAIVLIPSASTLLQTNGSKTIVISATGYSTNSVTQVLAAGTAAKLVITTQPTAPAADGGVLAHQPVVVVQDIYGNVTTSTASITNAAGQGTWTLGGTKAKAAVSGVATFTDLTAFSTTATSGVTIHFTSGSLTAVDSTPGFNIPAPIQSNLGGVALTGGKLKFTFTNATGLSFSVLATNNIAAPVTNWPVIGTAVEGPAGQYNFTNQNPATNSDLFYILRQP